MLLGVAAVGAVLLMSTLTIVFSAATGTTGGVATADPGTTTMGPPPATPGVPSAVPQKKASPFQGGDFGGFGTFNGGDWPGSGATVPGRTS